MNPEELNNALANEVAPQASAQPDTTDVVDNTSQAPTEIPVDKEPELILGKFKTHEDLANSYQELESLQGKFGQRMNDPDFIYQQAVRLGLAQEQPVEESVATPPSSPQGGIAAPPLDINRVVAAQVDAKIDYNEALQLLPELKNDRDLQAMAAALVNTGKSHVEAAKVLQKRMGLVRQEGEAVGAQSVRTAISDKEQAQTATQTTAVSSDAEAYADLIKRTKSKDRNVQNAAIQELLVRNMQSKRNQ